MKILVKYRLLWKNDWEFLKEHSKNVLKLKHLREKIFLLLIKKRRVSKVVSARLYGWVIRGS
jgi:hypothetical protein